MDDYFSGTALRHRLLLSDSPSPVRLSRPKRTTCRRGVRRQSGTTNVDQTEIKLRFAQSKSPGARCRCCPFINSKLGINFTRNTRVLSPIQRAEVSRSTRMKVITIFGMRHPLTPEIVSLFVQLVRTQARKIVATSSRCHSITEASRGEMYP